jgi:TIR domain
MRKVFMSHSARDADWARSFAQALKERCINVWFDEFDVQPGESLHDALESGLRTSDVLVALLDAESPAKPNLFFELGAAIGMGKRVVPIVPKGMDPSVLPLDVRLRRYLVGDTPEQTAEELSNTLQAA